MNDIEVVESLINRSNLIPVESSALSEQGIKLRHGATLLRCFECKDLYVSPNACGTTDYIYRVQYLMCNDNVRYPYKLTHYSNWAICNTIDSGYDGLYLSRDELWLNKLATDLIICENILTNRSALWAI